MAQDVFREGLIVTISHNFPSTFQHLMELCDQYNIDDTDIFGWSPLAHAICCNRDDMAKVLLDKGANLYIWDTFKGPLYTWTTNKTTLSLLSRYMPLEQGNMIPCLKYIILRHMRCTGTDLSGYPEPLIRF